MLERPLPILAWAQVQGDVDAGHRALYGRRFRRIGRFVKLAQLAAGRCVAGLPRESLASAGLYIGTGLGNTADIVPLAQGVLHPTRPRCSPMSFAGCLGNAASFFVAQAVGCMGPNVTLSQEELSFEGALLEAAMAIRTGRVDLALVGGVDVISGDDQEQRTRMNAQDHQGTITEGAAFLLLAATGSATARLEHVGLRTGTLERELASTPRGSTVLPGWRVGPLPPGTHQAAAPREQRLVPVATGLRLVETLEAGPTGEAAIVTHLQRNSADSWGRVQIGWR